MKALTGTSSRRQGGFVLIAVLIVLLALLVLTAPFLATARNAAISGSGAADRASARLALGSAHNHARSHLSRSHLSVDETPWSDSMEEFSVPRELPKEFLNHHDAKGVMWDLDVWDESGRVDLDSATPHVLANLIGMRTRLAAPVDGKADEIQLVDMDALPDQGVMILRGEWIRWTGKDTDEEPRLTGVVRGLGAYKDDEDKWTTEGPLPPGAHGMGAQALDQRAFALPLWRLPGAGGTLRGVSIGGASAGTSAAAMRGLDAFEQLAELDDFVVLGEVGPALQAALRAQGSVHGDVAAGRRWQHPTRLVSNTTAGETLTIRVEDARWFSEGSTIWISDGQVDVYRIIMRTNRGGSLTLNRVLDDDLDGWRATVRVLARRPVNLNSASREVLVTLFEGLQINGRNQRITGSEAAALAALVQESRPIEGWQDFLERIVLPAAGLRDLPADARVKPDVLEDGAALIDEMDATALYLNGLNANDNRLGFATMPFAFTSRDVFGMHLRSAVAAESGVERAHLTRDRWELIVPQRPLFVMVTRQEDFESAFRLDREAPWWCTGPNPVTRFDGATVPPSRFAAHMGVSDGSAFVPGFTDQAYDEAGEALQPERVFADREGDGFAQLWPARTPDSALWRGHALHFDQDTSTLEGRDLAHAPVLRDPTDAKLEWTTAAEGNLLRAISCSMWVKWRAVADSMVLDVAGASVESDRITLSIEGEDLVLRVLDAFGDHPDTDLREAAELRYALAPGDGPGLPAGVWHHLSIDVSGTRPDQIGLLVNGQANGVRRLGSSRTSGPVAQGDGFIPLESTEGFPQIGVARIGRELVEFVLSPGGLDCAFNETGPLAGFGGRFAREPHDLETTDPAVVTVPTGLGNINASYASGTTVTHYGFTATATSNVPAGQGVLAAGIGPFRVARVIPPDNPSDMVPIFAGAWMIDWGKGIESDTLGSLRLRLADDPAAEPGGEVMEAFSSTGGYAALLQSRWSAGNGGNQGDATPPNVSTTTEAPLGGVEIIRYSGWTGDTLQIAARGNQVQGELLTLGVATDLIGGSRAFVLEWRDFIEDGELNIPINELAQWGVYLVPISLPVTGVDDVSFLPPENPGESEFAQITRTDLGELTEWVRYDEIQVQRGQLVRSDPTALGLLYNICIHPELTDEPVRPDPPGGGGGGAGGGAGGGSGGLPGPGSGSSSDPPPVAPSISIVSAGADSGPQRLGTTWEPRLGEAEDTELPLTRSVASWWEFRGALGTASHSHVQGTEVHPVWTLQPGDVDRGRVGAQDPVFVAPGTQTHPGWPMRIHRAHRPAQERIAYGWEPDPAGGNLVAPVTAPTRIPRESHLRRRTMVAFNSALVEPIAPVLSVDPRLSARLAKHPSGERPRLVAGVVVGGGLRDGAAVPEATVDELLFPARNFSVGYGGAAPPHATQAGALMLGPAVGPGDEVWSVSKRSLRFAQGRFGEPADVLARFPQDAGLLRVDDEILCYESLNADQGEITISPLGRGLLGTDIQPHAESSPIHYLEWIPVSVLSANISAGDGALPLESTDGFPSSGLVLVGGELIHYTRLGGRSLVMPRLSRDPGRQDHKGDGLFRGRFGTAAQGHSAGTPVIFFPFRYWDRWTPRADAPELSYLSLEQSHPGAFWESFAFESEAAPVGGARIGLLVRTDPTISWDEDPDKVDGLLEYFDQDGGVEQSLGVAADRVEWRFFVEYPPGGFDALRGMSHDWRATPRLNWFGVTYHAPNRVLGSVDR